MKIGPGPCCHREVESELVRRSIFSIALALALLFAQQVGLAHVATHGAKHGATHQHGSGVKVLSCDECLAFANVQPNGCGCPHPTPCAQRAEALPPTVPAGFLPGPTVAFSSRGPPARS